MRVIHVASFNSSMANIGVVRQMQYELDAAKDLGLEWDAKLWAGDLVEGFDFIDLYPNTCLGRISRRWFFFKRLKALSFEYDFIFLRYMPVDPFLPFWSFFKVGGAKIFFVHHTKESSAVRSLYSGGVGLLFSLVELVCGFFSLRKAGAIIGVTKEIVDYEVRRSCRYNVPSFVYPNGIDFSRFPLVENNRGGKIKIVFTASNFFSWHGLSKILESLSVSPAKYDLELHLVGNVLEPDREFLRLSGLEGEGVVFVHGYLDIESLRTCLSAADIGLASFGIDDAGITQACTLKVREYLASGLPVYSGHQDVGVPSDFKYYKVGPPEISAIVEFALSMRKESRNKVRESARPYIEKRVLVKRIHDWVSDIKSERVL